MLGVTFGSMGGLRMSDQLILRDSLEALGKEYEKEKAQAEYWKRCHDELKVENEKLRRLLKDSIDLSDDLLDDLSSGCSPNHKDTRSYGRKLTALQDKADALLNSGYDTQPPA
jgi:hypothetical protein